MDTKELRAKAAAWASDKALNDLHTDGAHCGVQTVLWDGEHTVGKRHSKRAPLYSEATVLSLLEELDRLRSSNEAMRKALEKIAETKPSGHLDFHAPKHTGYAALAIAREALSSPIKEKSND